MRNEWEGGKGRGREDFKGNFKTGEIFRAKSEDDEAEENGGTKEEGGMMRKWMEGGNEVGERWGRPGWHWIKLVILKRNI